MQLLAQRTLQFKLPQRSHVNSQVRSSRSPLLKFNGAPKFHRTHIKPLRATADSSSKADSKLSAKEAVEVGLLKFQAGDVEKALELFERAQTLNPNEDECRAALYNAACCYTKLRRWEPAADAVLRAVNDYGLKLDVARKDPDLAPLRERREWVRVLNDAIGGVSEDAYIRLRSEAKAPFRLARIALFGTFVAASVLGLIFTFGRLAPALAGKEGAPDLNEGLQNLAINAGVLAGAGFLLARDLSGQERDQEITLKEEQLAQLQIALGPNRVVPVAAFRGSARPVIIAGSKGQVSKALNSAEPYYQELRKRGVCLVPVVVNDDDPADKLRKLKAELNNNSGSGTGDGTESGETSTSESSKPVKGFGKSTSSSSSASSPATIDVDSKDRKWQLVAAGVDEWTSWVEKQAKQVEAGNNKGIYVQVQLDGSVRASGVGIPPWQQFLADIPEMDSVRTKFGDGAGLL